MYSPRQTQEFVLSPDDNSKTALDTQIIDTDSDTGSPKKDAQKIDFTSIIKTYEAKPKEIQELLDRHEEARKQNAKEIDGLKHQLALTRGGHATAGEALKPIDAKDVKRPGEYDGETEFIVWYDRFRDLLINRHKSWEIIFKVIGLKGDKAQKFEEYAHGIATEIDAVMKQNGDPDEDMVMEYARQLKSYLSSYTKGALYSKLTKTNAKDVLDRMRDIIAKGKNKNRYRTVTLKAKILSPPTAKNSKELERILIDWKHEQAMVQ